MPTILNLAYLLNDINIIQAVICIRIPILVVHTIVYSMLLHVFAGSFELFN